jgi:hypothetical protein
MALSDATNLSLSWASYSPRSCVRSIDASSFSFKSSFSSNLARTSARATSASNNAPLIDATMTSASLMDLAIERLVLALADDAADAEETANSFEWRRLPRVLARRVAQMVDVVGVAAPHNVAAIDRLHRVVDDDEASTRLRVASSVRLDAAALARLAGSRANLGALDLSHCAFPAEDDASAVESVILGAADRLTELRMVGVHLPLAHCTAALAQLRVLDVSACRSLVSLAALCLATTQLESLEISQTVGVSDDDFVAVLQSAHTLRRLVADECSALSFGFLIDCDFPALAELSMAGCFLLTDATLAAIVRRCPMLERLDISKCSQVTQQSVLVIRELQHLRQLSVAWCGVTDLSPLNGERLRSFDGSWCMLLNDPNSAAGGGVNSLAVFVRTLVRVQSLRLAFTTIVDDEVVRAILTTCRSLVTLSIDGCNTVSADVFNDLSFPSSLQALSLYAVPMNVEVVHQMAQSSPMLQHLTLGIAHVDCTLMTLFPELVRLDLSHCSRADDAFLDLLWRHCPHIGDLLLGATKITDVGCRQSIARMSRLRLLSIGSTRVTDAAFELLPTTLISLMMQNVSAVTDAAVLCIVSRLRLLRSLNVSQCQHLSAVALDATSRLSMLTVLSVSYNRVFVSMSGALEMRISRTLRSLRLAACVELSDELLAVLLQQTPSLDLLDISNNFKLSKAVFDMIWMFCPKLASLQCRNCPNLAPADWSGLQMLMPHLSIS